MNQVTLFDLPVEDVVYRILSELTIAECLDLREIDELRDIVDSYLTQLKSLIANELLNVNTKKLMFLAVTCRKLQDLDLTHCISLTNDIVSTFFKNNLNLKTVNLSHTNGLTSHCLHALIHCKKLRELILLDDLWITPESILTVGHHLKNLQYIDISGCLQLDPSTIAAALSDCIIDFNDVF